MERPAEMVPGAPGEVLMENKVARTCLRRADFEQWGLGEGCPGCRYLRTGQERQQATAKYAGGRDQGSRSERHTEEASVVCHPESESQKKIALNTEQDSIPHPPVPHGGSPASDARPSATTSTDQNASTSDVSRASKEHIGGDFAMEGDSADESSAGDPNPSGSDCRRGITTKRGPVGDEKTSTTEQHAPRRILGKTTLHEHAVAVTTQEALDGSREKTMWIANVENALNWVSISSAGALDMTHCDFSARSAREEMRE